LRVSLTSVNAVFMKKLSVVSCQLPVVSVQVMLGGRITDN